MIRNRRAAARVSPVRSAISDKVSAGRSREKDLITANPRSRDCTNSAERDSLDIAIASEE